MPCRQVSVDLRAVVFHGIRIEVPVIAPSRRPLSQTVRSLRDALPEWPFAARNYTRRDVDAREPARPAACYSGHPAGRAGGTNCSFRALPPRVRGVAARRGSLRQTGEEVNMSRDDRICGLDVPDRGNLDPEMKAFVKGVEKKYGFMPNFVKAYATDNQRLRAFLGSYLELQRPDSGLTSFEHELIALVSAATNGCLYCTAHHGALMRGESGDALFTEILSRNYRQADLSPRHRAMLDFTVKVNADAESITDADRDALRAQGFSDETIWNIAATASFYAGANRMAQAIGLVPAREYLEMYREPRPGKRASSR